MLMQARLCQNVQLIAVLLNPRVSLHSLLLRYQCLTVLHGMNHFEQCWKTCESYYTDSDIAVPHKIYAPASIDM